MDLDITFHVTSSILNRKEPGRKQIQANKQLQSYKKNAMRTIYLKIKLNYKGFFQKLLKYIFYLFYIKFIYIIHTYIYAY